MKKKYKVLLLSTGGHIGGEETFTRNLAIALLSRGHSVVVAPGGQTQAEDLKKHFIPVTDLDLKGRTMKGLIRGIMSINRFLAHNEIDIVHCHAAGPAIMGAFSRIMKLEGAKRIWIWHDHGIKGLTYKWLPFFLNRLDMTIANSDYELIKLSGNGIANSKIVRIHNGIDCTRWVLPFDKRMQFKKEVREKYGIPLSSKVWGYVGRLSSEKGCDVFVTSAAEILEKYSNAYFLIVGDGGMRNELECEVRASHLEKKIIFAGFQTEMEKYISCLDVLILPSKMETFSLTILQAMALGIPVVATDVGGNPEQVVNGYTGYMCKTENPIDLAMKVCQLFANADNCNVMGKRAREIITNYLNTNRMMYQIETVYNDLLKRHTV